MTSKESKAPVYYRQYDNKIRPFKLEVKTSIASYNDLLRVLIAEGSPFHGYAESDLSIRVSPHDAPYPPTRVLRGDEELERALKNQRLWVITKVDVPISYIDEEGDECTIELQLWPEELEPNTVKLLVSTHLECRKESFDLYAVNERGVKFKIGNGTNLKQLLFGNFGHFNLILQTKHHRFGKEPTRGNTIPKESIEAAIRDNVHEMLFNSTFDAIFGWKPDPDLYDFLSALTASREPLTATDYSSLLQIPYVTIKKIIDRLNPILDVDDEGLIYFMHNAYPQYLTDPRKCNDPRFSVKLEEANAKLTSDCLNLLNTNLKYNMGNLPRYTLHKDIANFDQIVPNRIPRCVSYAALYFWEHFARSRNSMEQNTAALKIFAAEKLLNWVELLSLLQSTIRIPFAAEAILSEPSRNYVIDYTTQELFADIVRLYYKFNTAISASALQIYVTAVPFSPKECRLYKQYINKLPLHVPNVIAGTERMWSECLATFEGYSEWVTSVAISTDGRYVVSGTMDRKINVWVSKSGKLSTLEGHRGFVFSVAISEDGRFVVSGSADKTVKLWSISGEVLLDTLEGHVSWVKSVAISKDRKYIVSGSEDKTIRIWSLRTAETLRILRGHSNTVNSVAISFDGKLVISGSTDKTIKLWYLETGDEQNTLRGHTAAVFSVAISQDSQFIVSGSGDKTVKIWKTDTGDLLRTLSGHTDIVQSVDISRDGTCVVSGSSDCTIKVWTVGLVEKKPPKTARRRRRHWLNKLINLKGLKFISKMGVDRLMKWIKKYSGWVSRSSLSSSTSSHWSLEVIDKVKTLEGHNDRVSAVAISADGKLVVSGSEDTFIRLWAREVDSGFPTVNIGHTSAVKSIAVSPNNRFMISSNIYSNEIIVWNLATGEPEPEVNPNAMHWVRFPLLISNICGHGNPDMKNWDGWVVVDNKTLFWMPPEFRNGVVTGIYRW
ncbi:hypothetical protein HK098_007983 [Nowakowskiella sp. JEL0407]|nr:hypothetical protein HK098_007983 [Nowakowskiella sp. JEL0407]